MLGLVLSSIQQECAHVDTPTPTPGPMARLTQVHTYMLLLKSAQVLSPSCRTLAVPPSSLLVPAFTAT